MARKATYDRETALDAAMALFWSKGYNATSLKDLENALQMRPGSIYAAFENKENLFREALDRYAEKMAAEMQSLIAETQSPLLALQAHLNSMAELSPCDRPSTACMLVKSLLEAPASTELRAVILQHLDNVETTLEQVIQRAIETGELPAQSDPERLARRLQTYIFGLKIQAQRESDPIRMNQLCQDLSDEISGLRPAI